MMFVFAQENVDKLAFLRSYPPAVPSRRQCVVYKPKDMIYKNVWNSFVFMRHGEKNLDITRK
jgi:hypothetical protein